MERRAGERSVRSWVIAVAYDGEKTEAEYFAGWRSVIGQGALLLKPYYVRSGGNVRVAVQESVRKFSQDSDYDEAWCVCDRDDSNGADVEEARRIASEAGINLCMSTRSFETWLSLHWSRSARPVASEAEAIAAVSAHYPGYSRKNKAVPFDVLGPLSGEACRNGAWLEKQGVENPHTDMHRLAKRIIGQRRRLKG